MPGHALAPSTFSAALCPLEIYALQYSCCNIYTPEYIVKTFCNISPQYFPALFSNNLLVDICEQNVLPKRPKSEGL